MEKSSVRCAASTAAFSSTRGVVVVIERGEAVFDLLKRADDDAAVIRGGGVELGARLGDLRAAQAAVEHAEQGVRSDRPERARRAQPVREGGALEAALGAERERGKIRRTRHPDVGIGRDHAPLRGRRYPDGARSKVVGTPLGICGSVMATISGLIENVEADTPSSAAMACSISAR